ncbi:CBS domain-containing protein [Modicisalibacter ilicicola DSM 19980]|uniref:CBS domain-containing protein n=1 Tax=Modicisalibacter ilicicola DSM 19980 TaxID=1121942 RepID=A0A1M4ZDB0_9GAMM|nr:DUF294 nucleotidyltransferase-like domain-containing protein [Halomonas ilicicola]SHF15787.1 CBS domain-containing protein [Halomonas ilicicola DSM 19980]
MRVLYRASPWRGLFAEDTFPDPATLPDLLAPLREAFLRLGATPSLAETKAWQPQLVEALLRLDLPGWRISQLLSDHNDWLYRRSVHLALEEMLGSGWGEPPVSYCVLTLGSAARHESLLHPDQDNAMIVADYPDGRHDEIDGFFQALGERFTGTLGEAGIPLCQGHVMARWPMWRKRLSEWREQLRLWTGERRIKRVQQANILLDFHPVFGDASLAEALRECVQALMPRAGLFLDEMASLLDETPLALDRFGRLAAEDREAPHEQALNLKRQGVLPLQNAVRVLALVHGVGSVDSRGRLNELVMQGRLEAQVGMATIAALDRFQGLLLGAQMTALAAGRQPDNWLDLRRLEEGERLLLRHDLQQLRSLIGIAKAAVTHHR